MVDIFDCVLHYWREQGEKPALSTASGEDIEIWEKNYGVRLTDDLLNYVQRINGLYRGETLEFDINMNTLLPLCAMKPENEWDKNQPKSNFFVIADHCISCFWWTVQLDSEPHKEACVFLSGGTVPGEHLLVASSISEFLEMYIADRPAMYGLFRGGLSR